MKTFNWITVYVLALSATSCNAQLDNFPTVYDDVCSKSTLNNYSYKTDIFSQLANRRSESQIVNGNNFILYLY